MKKSEESVRNDTLFCRSPASMHVSPVARDYSLRHTVSAELTFVNPWPILNLEFTNENPRTKWRNRS